MRILLDANLSPRVAATLCKAGYNACHVVDVELGTAADSDIVDWATENDHIVVSSDSDFSANSRVSTGRRSPSCFCAIWTVSRPTSRPNYYSPPSSRLAISTRPQRARNTERGPRTTLG
jgi:hypothetical protein